MASPRSHRYPRDAASNTIAPCDKQRVSGLRWLFPGFTSSNSTFHRERSIAYAEFYWKYGFVGKLRTPKDINSIRLRCSIGRRNRPRSTLRGDRSAASIRATSPPLRNLRFLFSTYQPVFWLQRNRSHTLSRQMFRASNTCSLWTKWKHQRGYISRNCNPSAIRRDGW